MRSCQPTHRILPRRLSFLIVLGIVASTLFGSTASIAKSDVVDPGVVPNQYIVVFREQPGASKSTAAVKRDSKQLAQQYGGELKSTYSSALKGFTIKADKQAAEALANNPSVAKVVPDVWMEPTAVQQGVPSFYHLDRVDQVALPLDQQYHFDSERLLGQGVTVYVMDGALHASHPDFGAYRNVDNRVLPGVDFTGLGTEVCVDNPSPYDDNHGTQVAGIAVGLGPGHAKAARVQSIRVLDCAFSSTLSRFLAAVDWLTRNAKRPSVINMSIAFNREATFFFPEEQINLATAALQRSISTGLIYVAASANRFPDAAVDASVYFPGSVPEVITVGASDGDDRRAPFSNYGPLVDLHAPGVNVRSSTYAPEPYGHADGTSFAAPAVTGTIARLLGARPYATPAEVEQLLIANATQGALSDVGPGSANRLLYTRWIQESIAQDCNFDGWTSAEGQIATGASLPGSGFSRVLSPCGITAAHGGDYLTKALSHPLDEYSARFYVLPEAGVGATIFKAFGASGELLFDVRVAGSAVEVRPADGTASAILPLSVARWNSIELRWQAGFPGALTIDVGHAATEVTRSSSTASAQLFPSGGDVQRIEWGLIDGQAPAPLKFDAFVSKYGVAEAIGRVCRCDANLDGKVSPLDADEVKAELSGSPSFGHVDCNEDGRVDKGDLDELTGMLGSRAELACPI